MHMMTCQILVLGRNTKGVTPDPLVDWRTPYLDWLLHEVLSTDKTEARWIGHQAKSFVIIGEELYK